MLPQLGSGSRTPSPKKLRAASSKSMSASLRVRSEARIGMTLGSTCLARIQACEAPVASAAPMNSCSRTARALARTTRAIAVQPTSPRVKTTIQGEEGSTAARPMASSRVGKAMTISVRRMSSRSTHPRK
ncbi:hypothetical protein D3C86_1411580 [compost metagenome]